VGYNEYIEQIHMGLCKCNIKSTAQFEHPFLTAQSTNEFLEEIFKHDFKTPPKVLPDNEFMAMPGKPLYSGTMKFKENAKAMFDAQHRVYEKQCACFYWFSPSIKYALDFASKNSDENIIIGKADKDCKMITQDESFRERNEYSWRFKGALSITSSDDFDKKDCIANELFGHGHGIYRLLAKDIDAMKFPDHRLAFARRKNLCMPQNPQASRFKCKGE
jgi:hypothetical protein